MTAQWAETWKTSGLRDMDDYCLALLWLMGQLGQAEVGSAYGAFKQQFAGLMRPELHELKLRSSLHGARQKLVGVDLLGSGGRGVWVITPVGQEWLADQADPGQAKDVLHTLLMSSRQRRGSGDEPGVGDGLLPAPRRKGTLASVLPAQTEGQQGVVRGTVQRPRKRRAEAASLRRARSNLEQMVSAIHKLLQGTLPSRPTDEVLCDWVHLCSTLELYVEACHLFAYISPAAVDPVLYQQAHGWATLAAQHMAGDTADLMPAQVMAADTADAGVLVFDNDDAGYLEWLAEHPEGFVLNTRRSKAPDAMVLHRATCSTIRTRSKQAKVGLTERNIKVCASDVARLKQWAEQYAGTAGSLSQGCLLCKPLVER